MLTPVVILTVQTIYGTHTPTQGLQEAFFNEWQTWHHFSWIWGVDCITKLSNRMNELRTKSDRFSWEARPPPENFGISKVGVSGSLFFRVKSFCFDNNCDQPTN